MLARIEGPDGMESRAESHHQQDPAHRQRQDLRRNHRRLQYIAFDEGFVGKTKFNELVVQGGLTSGILNALVAMDMLGPGIVFMSQDRKFIAPVFIGDTITAEAEVLEVHATKPVTKLKITITRQTRETVLEGEAWCYTFTPEG